MSPMISHLLWRHYLFQKEEEKKKIYKLKALWMYFWNPSVKTLMMVSSRKGIARIMDVHRKVVERPGPFSISQAKVKTSSTRSNQFRSNYLIDYPYWKKKGRTWLKSRFCFFLFFPASNIYWSILWPWIRFILNIHFLSHCLPLPRRNPNMIDRWKTRMCENNFWEFEEFINPL